MMLTGEDLIVELDKLLDVHPAGEDAPYLGLIDGVLAALALSPEPVAPDEWLPQLGFSSDAPFPQPGDVERFRELLQARQHEIVGQLLQGGLAFEPIYEFGDEGEPLWQIWLIGFMQGMKLRFDAWQPLFASEDEDLAAALSGLIAMASTFPGLAGAVPEIEGREEIAEMTEMAPTMIPYLVETIYRRRQGLPRVVLDDWNWSGEEQPELFGPIRVTKIGRNEPCPCGSGKKYKKCCGQ